MHIIVFNPDTLIISLVGLHSITVYFRLMIVLLSEYRINKNIIDRDCLKTCDLFHYLFEAISF